MEDPQTDEQQPDPVESPQPSRMPDLRAFAGRMARGALVVVREFGLFLFMLLLPLLLLGYPAYLIGAKLWDHQTARVVEARLERIEINTVEHDQDRTSWLEARKHIDIIFYFKGQAGEKLASVSEHSWPAPGLKRKLQEQYQPGDEFTLYILPDQSIVKDVDLAVSNFYRMTALMGLLFLTTLMAALIWKRLLHQMPESLPNFPQAGLNSFLTAQGIALLVAALFAWINTFSTMLVPNAWYLATYWGLVGLLTLSLRLLVFMPPPAPAKPVEDEDEPRASRLRAARE